MSNYLIEYDSSLVPIEQIFEPLRNETPASLTHYRDNNDNDINTLFAPYTDEPAAIQTNYYTYQSSVKKDLNEVFQAMVVFPVGHIMIWPSSTPPINYLLADGTSYDVTSYPELYNVIGITYGGVVGSTFNVPNMTQQAMPYYDTNNTLSYGDSSGVTVVSLYENQLPLHTHTTTDNDAIIAGHTHFAYPANASFVYAATMNVNDNGTGNIDPINYVVNISNNQPLPNQTGTNTDTIVTFNTNQTGVNTNNSSGSLDIQNPYIIINYVIKYK
jgi:microcystin-dependent protein